MVECNSIGTPDTYPNLNDQQQFRLNKINETEYYFAAEIKEKQLMSHRHNDQFDKSLIVLSATTGSFSIALFAPVIEAPGGKASASFSLVISIFTEIVKKVLKTTRNKKEKHNKIVMLAMSKLNSIESKISEALTNNEIRLERFNGKY